MHSSILVLLVIVAIVTGTPLSANLKPRLSPVSTWSPENSTFVCMFLSSVAGWEGEQENLCEVGGQCANQLPTGLNKNVSSAGPTQGQVCFLYANENCTGNASVPIVYPGYADLSEIGFEKMASSWRCYRMCGFVIGGNGATSTTLAPVTSGTTSALSLSSSSGTTGSVTSTMSPSLSASSGGNEVALDSSTTLPPSITATLSETQTTVPSSSISTTLSQTQTTASSPSITSNFSGTLPTVTSQATTQSTLSSSTSSLAPQPSVLSNILSSTIAVTSVINTNTPGFSLSSSPVTIIHTYANGSTTIVTTSVIEPVPTVPSHV